MSHRLEILEKVNGIAAPLTGIGSIHLSWHVLQNQNIKSHFSNTNTDIHVVNFYFVVLLVET